MAKLNPEIFREIVDMTTEFPHVDVYGNGEILYAAQVGSNKKTSRVHISVTVSDRYDFLFEIIGKKPDLDSFSCSESGLSQAIERFNDAYSAHCKNYLLEKKVDNVDAERRRIQLLNRK